MTAAALPPLGPINRQPRRTRVSVHEQHAPGLDPAFCLHCGFAWAGHPAAIRAVAVGGTS